jgi:hypothetical protein
MGAGKGRGKAARGPGCQMSAGLCGLPFLRKRYLKIDTFRVRMPGADAGPYMLPPPFSALASDDERRTKFDGAPSSCCPSSCCCAAVVRFVGHGVGEEGCRADAQVGAQRVGRGTQVSSLRVIARHPHPAHASASSHRRRPEGSPRVTAHGGPGCKRAPQGWPPRGLAVRCAWRHDASRDHCVRMLPGGIVRQVVG